MWVILDRDGVINYDSDTYIKSPSEWRAIEGSLEAIAKLCQVKIPVCVATNQSGLARGYFDKETLNAMHQKFLDSLSALGGHITEITYCPHGPNEGCRCRKPEPGMLENLSKKTGLPLSEAYFIGDTIKDIQAAQAVGATPILVKTGKGCLTLEKHQDKLNNVATFDNLAAFVDHLLSAHDH